MSSGPINITLNNVNAEVEQWVKSAPPEDISLAIEIGFPLLSVVKNTIAVKVGESQRVKPSLTSQSTDVPTYKGQNGEAFVESLLRQRFGEVTNVAKVSKSGDLTLYIQHRKIIVEVKNYSNPVPSSGVEKFQRDLNTTNACGGIFISLRTPITGVTADFAIRYEPSDTKTVPCAYIVTSDTNTIFIAVNMISSLIQSFDYLNAELYNKDKIISSVYDIADKLDEISRVRNDLQIGVGELSSQMMKTTLGLASAESGIRRVVDNMRGELFHVTTPDVGPALNELEKLPMFSRQDTETKACVAGVMKCVQETLHRTDINGAVWKLSAKKCVNTLSGIGFTFFANRVEVSLPRTKISANLLVSALDTFGKKVSIGDCLCIDLDKTTYDWVCRSIRNVDTLITK